MGDFHGESSLGLGRPLSTNAFSPPSLSQYSDENMMDPHNLAVCFGPTLVTVPAGQDAVSVQPHINEVVKCLIVHHEAVFPGTSQLSGPQYEKVMALTEEEYW